MRSTLMIASLLAVLPVRLISLALRLRIHMFTVYIRGPWRRRCYFCSERSLVWWPGFFSCGMPLVSIHALLLCLEVDL